MKFENKKIITLILIIIWMGIVFYFSNQVSEKSANLSGGLTRTILEVLGMLEGKTLEEQYAIGTVIRKLAHYSIYALGGILILLHINLYKIKEKRKIILGWVVGTLYAITDEIHQLFVPGRSGEIRDVFLDSLGVITGIAFLLIIFRIIELILYQHSKRDN